MDWVGLTPALDPERIRSVEGGLRARHPRWPAEGEMSIYQLEIRDMLLPFQSESSASEETYYRNAGRARNRGLELALSAHPSARIDVQLAYTYSQFTFVDYVVDGVQLADNEVPGLPAHRTFASVRTYPFRSAFVGIDFEAVSDYFANDYNGPPPGGDGARADFINGGYMRVDGRLGWKRSGWTVLPVSTTSFDQRYNGSIVPNAFGNRFFEPASGRTLYAGCTWDGIVRE